MKIAFIYNGQGSQVENLGKDIYYKYEYVKDFYNSIDISFDLKDYSFNKSLEEISKTRYTQAILLAYQISVTDILKKNNIYPSYALGLSLGEYSALYASEVLTKEDSLKIIDYRSKYMSDVEKKIDSSMLAIFTEDIKKIEAICKVLTKDNKKIEISNINTVGQIVVSGNKTLIEEIRTYLKIEKIKSIKLNTSGPFHTSYMNEVEDKLYNLFKNIEFKSEKVPVIYNYTANFLDDDIKKIMSRQVSNTVLFKDSLEKLLNEDIDLVIEIGYGNIIKNFLKKIDRKVKVLTCSSLLEIENTIRKVKEYDK